MIEKVVYEVIDECTAKEASELYYHQTVMGLDPVFIPAYEEYETKYTKLRNNTLHKASEKYGVRPDMRHTIYGASSLSDNAIIIAKI